MKLEGSNRTLTIAALAILVIVIAAAAFNVVSDWSKEEFAVPDTVDVIQVAPTVDETDVNAYLSFTSSLTGVNLIIKDEDYRIPTKITVDEGLVEYTVSKDGYVTKTSSISVYNGYITTVDVKLEQLPEEVVPIEEPEETVTPTITATPTITPDETVISTPTPTSTPVPTPTPITYPVEESPVQIVFISAVNGVDAESGYEDNVNLMKKLYLINAPITLTQAVDGPYGIGTIEYDTTTKMYTYWLDFENSDFGGEKIYYSLASDALITSTISGSVNAPYDWSGELHEISVMPKNYGFLLNLQSLSDNTPIISGNVLPVAYEKYGVLQLGEIWGDVERWNVYISEDRYGFPNAPQYTIYQWMVDDGIANFAQLSIRASDAGSAYDDVGLNKNIYVKIVDNVYGTLSVYEIEYDLYPNNIVGVTTIKLATT